MDKKEFFGEVDFGDIDLRVWKKYSRRFRGVGYEVEWLEEYLLRGLVVLFLVVRIYF